MKEIMGIYGPGREQYTKRMAANLPMLRMKLGLSQTELAELMGVTRQTVSAVENGVRPLSGTDFSRCCSSSCRIAKQSHC